MWKTVSRNTLVLVFVVAVVGVIVGMLITKTDSEPKVRETQTVDTDQFASHLDQCKAALEIKYRQALTETPSECDGLSESTILFLVQQVGYERR